MKARILTGRFGRLPAGYYAAASDSPAYYQAKAMKLPVMGETLFPYGQHGLYFRVGNPSAARRNPEEIGTTEMRMGDDDWSTVKNEYSEWTVKWFREVIQNAVDAGARNVALRAEATSEGTWIVSCEDDGVGMDQATFTDVFMVLKGTRKPAGGIGGFGEAKKLIVLPWISWRIASRDRVYTGVGRTAKIFSAPMRRGTLVEVIMGSGDNEHCHPHSARAVLAKSFYPSVRFTVNGDVVPANYRPTDELFRVGDKAIGYFVPSPLTADGDDSTNQYVVTARDGNGTGALYMFTKYMDTSKIGGTIVVELTGPSKDILTANRDGFRKSEQYDIERTLMGFIQRAAADVSSAFKSRHNLIEKTYEGIGKFKAEPTEQRLLMLGATHRPLKPVKAARGSPDVTFEVEAEYIKRVVADLQYDTQGEESAVGVVSPDAAAEYLDARMTGTDEFENALRLISWRPDFYVINEIKGYIIPDAFEPTTMKSRIRKLAKVWAELVRYVLIQLNYQGSFGVGWVFSKTDTKRYRAARTAACFKRLDKNRWILLNPFLSDKMDEIFLMSRADHVDQLYALAIHECTHMVNAATEHDEIFTSHMTFNMAKCSRGFRKLGAIVKAIKMKGDPDL